MIVILNKILIETQKNIGYLPEHCPLYTEMTVIDYLNYVADLRNITLDQRVEKIKSVIQKTELAEKAKDLISTLSKGYRQRVGIAQAILHEPEILILDEPTSGLDPSQIQEIRNLIRELSEHSTVILSTHIMQEVEAVCDRVIIMARGEIALDSHMSDLHSSNRLILSTDKGLDEISPSLKKLSGVRSIDFLGNRGSENSYALEIEPNGSNLNTEVAKVVVNEGFQLFSLHPERKNLESVFREINSAGGANE